MLRRLRANRRWQLALLFTWNTLLFTSASLAAPAQVIRHVAVYSAAGRFGGWPANHGIWSWGDEILVGFSAGYYKDLGADRHAIDRERPEEHLLAAALTVD